MNLSDLAAKGARPLGVLVSHMLGDSDARFIEGLCEILGEYDVALLGGDTVRAEGRRVWGCTAVGKATHAPAPDRCIRRCCRSSTRRLVDNNVGEKGWGRDKTQ